MPRRRTSQAIKLAAAAVGILAAASCTSASPNRSVEKHECATVGRLTGSPPEDTQRWVRQITIARNSGDDVLDTAVRELAAGLRQNESTRMNAALARVTRVCVSLGLWQVYHG